jgi:hypothetical protein
MHRQVLCGQDGKQILDTLTGELNTQEVLENVLILTSAALYSSLECLMEHIPLELQMLPRMRSSLRIVLVSQV